MDTQIQIHTLTVAPMEKVRHHENQKELVGRSSQG